jgi:hypothetical protein
MFDTISASRRSSSWSKNPGSRARSVMTPATRFSTITGSWASA